MGEIGSVGDLTVLRFEFDQPGITISPLTIFAPRVAPIAVRRYRPGRWMKRKGTAYVRLRKGDVRLAESHTSRPEDRPELDRGIIRIEQPVQLRAARLHTFGHRLLRQPPGYHSLGQVFVDNALNCGRSDALQNALFFEKILERRSCRILNVLGKGLKGRTNP